MIAAVRLLPDRLTDGDRVRWLHDGLCLRVEALADRARHADDPTDLQSEIYRHARALVVVGGLLQARR